MRISGFGYLIKEGFKNVWNNRLMSVASICVLVSCLVLTGSASLLSLNVSKVVKSVGNNNETVVYLDYKMSRVESVYVGRDIEKLENVTSVEYISRDDAFKGYKDKLGKDIFDSMKDDNPLPDSFRVTMADLSLYEETVKEISSIEGVEKVSSRAELAKRLTSINNLVQMSSFWIILALTIISLFIISNTIRATMYSRRFEISIMKSVGATNSFVRIPFVVEGITIGLIAAILSTGALVFLYDIIMEVIVDLIPFSYIPIENVIVYVIGVFMCAGMLIGAISGFVSIRKYLKMEGNEILGW